MPKARATSPKRGMRTRYTVTGINPDRTPATAVQARADYIALRLTLHSRLMPSREARR